MNKLQKRERVLLVVLAVVLLAVLPYFYVTKKIIAKHEILSSEVEILVQKRQSYEERQVVIETLKQKLSLLDKEALKLRIDSGSIGKTYDAHYILTNLAAKNNIKLNGLSISDPTLIEMETGVVAPDGVKEESLRKPMKMAIVLNLKGSLSNMMSLVDDIEATSKNFVVESFTSGDLSIESDVSVQMGLSIYLVLSEEERMRISGS